MDLSASAGCMCVDISACLHVRLEYWFPCLEAHKRDRRPLRGAHNVLKVINSIMSQSKQGKTRNMCSAKVNL